MQPNQFTCSRCGAPLAPGATECANCGLTFDTPVPAGPMPIPGAQPPRRGNPAGVIIAVVALFGFLFVGAILAAILFPVFAKAREKARETVSMNNLNIIGQATVQYTQDYDEVLPPTTDPATYKAAINSYVPNLDDKRDPFIQPGAGTPYQVNPKISCVPIAKIQKRETTYIAREASPASDGKVAILYVDGHVDRAEPGRP